MICESCNKYEATVAYTHIVENKKTTVHLCNFCASRGDEEESSAEQKPVPGAKVVIELTQVSNTEAEAVPAACSGCGMTYEEFRKAGRFGCQDCYAAFDGQLQRLMKRIHGSVQNEGKQLVQRQPLTPQVEDLEELRKALEAAVAEEAFERAAELRDRILQLESSGGGD